MEVKAEEAMEAEVKAEEAMEVVDWVEVVMEEAVKEAVG